MKVHIAHRDNSYLPLCGAKLSGCNPNFGPDQNMIDAQGMMDAPVILKLEVDKELLCKNCIKIWEKKNND